MFGMKKEAKHPVDDFVFDLEKDLQEVAYYRAVQEKLVVKAAEIKAKLRLGGDPKRYEQWTKILKGYNSAKKVVERVYNRKLTV